MKDSKTQTAPNAQTVPRAEYEEVAAKYEEVAAKYAGAQDVIGRQKETIRALAEMAGRLGIPADLLKGDVLAGNERIEAIEKHLDAAVAAQSGRGVRGDGRHRVWMRMDILDEYIQNDRQLHALTLLKSMKFEYITYLAEEYMETEGGKLYYDLKMRGSDPGNRSKLKIRYIVFMSFFAKRTNLVPAVIGALFGMDRTTVVRQIDFIDGVLEAVLPGITSMGRQLAAIEDSDEFIKFTKGELLHDGTLTRAPDSADTESEETSGFSGKHHTPGFNTVLTCTGAGLLVASSKTVPGNRHDFRVIKENPVDLGLFHMKGEPKSGESAKVMKKTDNLFDKGFVGAAKHFKHIKSLIPHRGRHIKSPKEIGEAYRSGNDAAVAAALGLTPEQYAENRKISSRRSLIERVIGRLKRWDILAGPFRGTASELNRQFDILGGITNLDILWPEIERNEAPLLAMLAARRAAYVKKR